VQSQDVQAGDRVNILLVDDRPENLLALEAVLESANYSLIRAQSGTDALKQVLLKDFAAILLDVQMPGMDGFETAALIRKRERSRHVPILFITAINKDEPYVHKGYALGAADYIFKPFDPEVLRAKVGFFVELFEKNRQIARQAELLRQSEQREKQRQLAELRRQNEVRYRNLADAIPQIVWTASASGYVDYVNQRGVEYVGRIKLSPSKLMRTLLHPADYPPAMARWKEATRAGHEFSIELRLQRGVDKVYRWHLVHLQPEIDSHGRLVAWLGTATDIDDQKRTEQALAAEKERLSVTLRSIGEGVITCDRDDKVVMMNGAAEKLTGWTQEEAAGQPLTEVFRITADRRHANTRADEIGTGAVQMTAHEENRLLSARDGSTRLIEYTLAPIRTAQSDQLGQVLVFRDTTDRRRLEEERQKASKLESIGVLAGAIAHDFNNMLTAIMGNISLARIYSEQNTEVYTRLGDAENAIMWAKDLTQQLLTFAKGGTPVRKTCDRLDRLVRESADFAARGSHLRCAFELDEGVWPVDIDEGQIRQVVHNLVINAQQAMPVDGEIVMKVSNVLFGDARLPLPPGRYVMVTCEDHGMGIAPEHLPKIFDPYFTTKQQGSGLGLATAYSIVKKHDGLITVESELGRGTRFHIYLPATETGQRVESAEAKPPPHGQGKILVMDDEPRIREMLGRVLGHFGYELGFAEDGAEAVAQYEDAKRSGAPFDVVIMDLIVPGGMGGKEAIQKLRQVDPTACVIVSSGYSNDPIMSDFRSFGFCEAVAKPYRHEDLREVLHRVMSRRECAA
jgi:PAS domain S-box-containing protein